MPLVDVDLAIDTAIDAADEWDCDFSFERDRKIRDAFMALPTVDAVPVRHGRWTIGSYRPAAFPYCCSNCKAFHRARYGYCPSCGAKMDGKYGDDNG